GGAQEACTASEYDALGRVTRTYVAFFSGATAGLTLAGSGPFATTAFDALGRVTAVTPPGLPPTTTSYAGLTATVTDANGNPTQTTSDLLGHVVRVQRYWNTEGRWLATTNVVDAAGRLLATSDPAGNTLSFAYDGLGRKTDMQDPDLGHWTYAYD